MSIEISRDPESVTWLENLISGLNLILKGEDDYTDLELYAISAEELLKRTGENPVKTPHNYEAWIHEGVIRIITGLNEVLNNISGWDGLALYVSQLKTLADKVDDTDDEIDDTDDEIDDAKLNHKVDKLIIQFIKNVYTTVKPSPTSEHLQFIAQKFQKQHDTLNAMRRIFDDDLYSAFIIDKVHKMYGGNEEIKETFLYLLQIWYSHVAEWDDCEEDDNGRDQPWEDGDDGY